MLLSRCQRLILLTVGLVGILLISGCNRTGRGAIDGVLSIKASPNGNIYAVGEGPGFRRLQCFDSSGRFIRKVTDSDAFGIAADSVGILYVPDILGISKFDASGNALGHFRIHTPVPIEGPSGCDAVAVARNGDMYIRMAAGYVVRCDASGHYISKILSDYVQGGPNPFLGDLLALTSRGNLLIAGDYYFWKPNGTDCDIWSCIKEYTPSGKYIQDVLSPQDTRAMGLRLRSIALNSKDEIYIADGEGVWKLSPTGKRLSHWRPLAKDGTPGYSECVAVDSKGYVYVGMGWDGRILKYDPSGKLVTEWQMKNDH